jgi:hypothetical protein
MNKVSGLTARIVLGLAFLTAAQTAAQAQYNYNYSSDRWVNSSMNLLFRKRWEIARIRAKGKHQLADALEGRRTPQGEAAARAAKSAKASTATRAGTAAKAAPAQGVLPRAPLSQTSFKRISLRLAPTHLFVKFLDKDKEQRELVSKAASQLLKNYDEMLVRNRETRLKDNVAGAATFALLMSRSVLLDGKSELSEQQSEALLQDINALLASSDKFKKLSRIDKQEMYEMFIVSGGFAAMLYQQGTEENNPKKAAQGKELARIVLSQFFDRPLEAIDFTSEGVQFK